MVELLLAWYGQNRRDLPWRETHDPYAILISEVMLQQTQVARVVPRYLEWLERWPTAEALAAAAPADVILAWSGLGYNRRAVNLHRCAQAVAARCGFPREPDELAKLPGIGPYTAAAVACFAFGAQIAAPDTNALRVLERAFPGADVPAPPGRAYEWNQALFDLGRVPVPRPHVRPASAPVALRGLVPAAAGAPPARDLRRRAAARGRVRRRGAGLARARRPRRGVRRRGATARSDERCDQLRQPLQRRQLRVRHVAVGQGAAGPVDPDGFHPAGL